MYFNDDITFCQKNCRRTSCFRNYKNIKHHDIPHSFFVETPPDCPKMKGKDDGNHEIYHVREKVGKDV